MVWKIYSSSFINTFYWWTLGNQFLTIKISTNKYSENLWPIEVGKVKKMNETGIISTFIIDETDIEKETWNYTIKVEAQEKITVQAWIFTFFWTYSI